MRGFGHEKRKWNCAVRVTEAGLEFMTSYFVFFPGLCRSDFVCSGCKCRFDLEYDQDMAFAVAYAHF